MGRGREGACRVKESERGASNMVIVYVRKGRIKLSLPMSRKETGAVNQYVRSREADPAMGANWGSLTSHDVAVSKASVANSKAD